MRAPRGLPHATALPLAPPSSRCPRTRSPTRSPGRTVQYPVRRVVGVAHACPTPCGIRGWCSLRTGLPGWRRVSGSRRPPGWNARGGAGVKPGGRVQSPPGAISLVGDAPRSRQDGQGGSRVRMTRVPMIPTAWARTTCPLRFQSRGMYRTPSCSWQGFDVSCWSWFTIVNTSRAGTAGLMVVAESPSREDLILGDFAFRPSNSLSHAVTAAGHLADPRTPTPRHARRPSG